MTLQSVPPTTDDSNIGATTLEYSARSALDAPDAPRGGSLLAPAFGMTVAAWTVAYISRMPVFPVPAPGQVTVSLMLASVFIGGLLTARYSRRGALAALLAGMLSGVLDILIIGSILHDSAGSGSIVPAAGLWIGGSILLNGIVSGVGGLLGALFPSDRRGAIRWSAVFALVLVAATLPLITAGGLVTAYGVGMAVPDWPQSYGYNMFLFPLSQMQAAHGNFYEHAHRLMGSLVGLTAMALAVYITMARRETGLKVAAWCIFAAVCVQGLLGGLRVTENSILLATIHGIFAQLVFAAMACLTVAGTRTFAQAPPRIPGAADRQFSAVLLAFLVLQLALGAFLRQRVDSMLLIHITLAAGVALLGLACGFRAVALHGSSAGVAPLRRAGMLLMILIALQLLLGVTALVLRPGSPNDPKTTTSALWTTAHQANGAMLLAVAAVIWLWNVRLFSSEVPAYASATEA